MTKLEAWLEEFSESGTVLTVNEARQAIAVIEQLKAALETISTAPNFVSVKDINDAAYSALAIDPEEL